MSPWIIQFPVPESPWLSDGCRVRATGCVEILFTLCMLVGIEVPADSAGVWSAEVASRVIARAGGLECDSQRGLGGAWTSLLIGDPVVGVEPWRAQLSHDELPWWSWSDCGCSVPGSTNPPAGTVRRDLTSPTRGGGRSDRGLAVLVDRCGLASKHETDLDGWYLAERANVEVTAAGRVPQRLHGQSCRFHHAPSSTRGTESGEARHRYHAFPRRRTEMAFRLHAGAVAVDPSC